jgi:hypothetical protein
MRRALSNLFSVTAMLLCVTAAGLWVRGYRVADAAYVHVPPTRTHFMFASSRGRLEVIITPFPPDRAAAGADLVYMRRPPVRLIKPGGFFQNYVSRLGVEVAWTPNRPERAVAVPTWSLLALTAVPSALWVRRHVRRIVRRAKGRCLECGYDLRASRAGCPECGAGQSAAAGPGT